MCIEKMELLAPAGNFDALRAAVCGGADAVYLGLDSFNARRGADNFTLKTLRAACDYAHLRQVKIYLTFNTIVFEKEMPRAMETIRQAYRAGVDAFIVQDIGIAAELKRTLPQARLHISTQMNTHSLAGIQAAADLGAARVTFARELSLEQIELLSVAAHDLGMETESFAHGALCVCYSGQCYMSSMIGGRSANRGTCAQACRLPYTLKNKAIRKDLPAPGEHLLSPKDLCTIDILDQLHDAGVSSLKVEGRMKSPDYVYAVVSVYRRVLDRFYAARAAGRTDTGWQATKSERSILEEAFSRGFTTAYMTHERGNDMMNYQRPNNRGVFVGRVSRVVKDSAFVTSDKKLHAGDLLEIWTKKGRSLLTVPDEKPLKDGSVRLPFQKGDKTVQFIREGDRAFRVRNASASFEVDEFSPRVVVDGHVMLKLGAPARVRFEVPAYLDELGGDIASAEAVGDVVEAARTKAVTETEVAEHINRLGQTPFELRHLEVELDAGAGIGFSQLHKLRAQALELLEQQIVSLRHDRKLPRVEDLPETKAAQLRGYGIYVRVSNPACARAAKRAGAKGIYVSALEYKRGQAVVAGQLTATAEQAGYPKGCTPVLPVMDYDLIPSSREAQRQIDVWDYVKEGQPVLVENWADVCAALEAGAEVEVGAHVPAVNGKALQKLADAGVSRVWLSPELTLGQIEDLGKEGSPVPLGLTIIGRTELMTTEHCLLMSQGPCDENCAECPRRKSPHYLVDRKGFEFPVVTDALGRSHLYNSVDLDVAQTIPELIAAGVTAFMVDATMMNVEETAHAVGRAVRALEIGRRDGNTVAKVSGATTGHLFRAVE